MSDEPDEMVSAIEQWFRENPPLTQAALQAQITQLQAELAEARNQALEEAARTALNPGFIQARDDEWDTGFNDAKRIIASAIRDLKATAIEARDWSKPDGIIKSAIFGHDDTTLFTDDEVHVWSKL